MVELGDDEGRGLGARELIAAQTRVASGQRPRWLLGPGWLLGARLLQLNSSQASWTLHLPLALRRKFSSVCMRSSVALRAVNL